MTVTKIPTESGGYEIAGERERVVQGYTQSILDTIEGAAIDRQIAMLSDAIRPLFSLRNDLYGAERNRKKAEAEPEPETGTEAALAVQPAPTDAEIEAAIEHQIDLAIPIRDAEHTAALADCGYPKNWDAMLVEYDDARASLLRLIAQQRAAARRKALEAVRGAFGILSESAFAYEIGVSGDGETMYADYVPLGIITAMSEAFGTDRWVPFLIEHGFAASEDEYALLAKEGGDDQ